MLSTTSSFFLDDNSADICLMSSCSVEMSCFNVDSSVETLCLCSALSRTYKPDFHVSKEVRRLEMLRLYFQTVAITAPTPDSTPESTAGTTVVRVISVKSAIYNPSSQIRTLPTPV